LVIKYGAVFTTAISFFIGLLLYIPAYLIIPTVADIGAVSVSTATSSWWIQILYLGVITSGVGYGLWYYALGRLESGRVAVFDNLQPILTTVLAW
jgi:drug/metabolite transporter (DMT)-like permease